MHVHSHTTSASQASPTVTPPRDAPPPSLLARVLVGIRAFPGCFGASRASPETRSADGRVAEALSDARNPLQPDPATRAQGLAQQRPDEIPGHLYAAMEHDRHADVGAYGRSLLQSGVPPAQRADLLTAGAGAGDDWRPGLFMALQKGYANTIRAFGNVLCDSGLPPEAIVRLLQARRGDGVPGLQMALQRNRAEAIEAFGRVLAQCDLDEAQCVAVLAARTRGDQAPPGLHMALQEGKAEAVRAFGDAMLHARLGESQRANLLAARRLNGTPGVFMAMQNGCDEAVRAWGDVLVRCTLHPDSLASLLEAKGPNGTSALDIAMQQDHPWAVRAFGDILEATAPALGRERLMALLQLETPREDSPQARIAYEAVVRRLRSGQHLPADDLDRSTSR